MTISKSKGKKTDTIERKAKVLKGAHVVGKRQKPKYEYPGGYKTEKEFLNSIKGVDKAELEETMIYE